MLSNQIVNLFALFFWIASVSLLFFIRISYQKTQKLSQVLISILVVSLSVIGLSGWFLADHYTGQGINDAALFQVKHGTTGLQFEMVWPIFLSFGALFFGVISYAFSLFVKFKRTFPPPTQKKQDKVSFVYYFLILVLLIFNPGFSQSATLLFLSYKAQQNIEHVMEHARLPETPPPINKPLSVVYIYAEGFEGTFMNEKAFPNLTPNLKKLSQNALVIHGIRQVPFTGWTIAGQIASNCGFPGSEGNLLSSDAKRWPCATHILANEGYNMVYLNGSRLDFSGKGDFWRSQGFKELYGDKSINVLSDYNSERLSIWGAYDDALFKAAFRKYKELKNRNSPFVLTMLTVDTHAPVGLKTPACSNLPIYKTPNNKEYELLQAVHCSDLLLSEFVQKVLNEKDDNTIIVLQSDHLQTPKADVFPLLENAGNRENWLGAVKFNRNLFQEKPQLLILPPHCYHC